MNCPVCESPNPEDALDCAVCGKQLLLEGEVELPPEHLDGLETTVLDPLESAAGAVAPMGGLETTQLVAGPLEVAVEAIEVERTPLEARLDLPSNWTGGVDLDPTRIPDDGERTAAPVDTGHCPWCGAAATGLVCDGCGRRRTRYTTAPQTQEEAVSLDDTLLCPACFSRVKWEGKCPECGVPLPLREI